jgi:hypothetical protein
VDETANFVKSNAAALPSGISSRGLRFNLPPKRVPREPKIFSGTSLRQGGDPQPSVRARRGTGSFPTRRWREVDSNHRYPIKKQFFWAAPVRSLQFAFRNRKPAPSAGTDGSNPSPSSGESIELGFRDQTHRFTPRNPPRNRAGLNGCGARFLSDAKISTSANARFILTFIVGSQCVQAPTAERLACLREEGRRALPPALARGGVLWSLPKPPGCLPRKCEPDELGSQLSPVDQNAPVAGPGVHRRISTKFEPIDDAVGPTPFDKKPCAETKAGPRCPARFQSAQSDGGEHGSWCSPSALLEQPKLSCAGSRGLSFSAMNSPPAFCLRRFARGVNQHSGG